MHTSSKIARCCHHDCSATLCPEVLRWWPIYLQYTNVLDLDSNLTRRCCRRRRRASHQLASAVFLVAVVYGAAAAAAASSSCLCPLLRRIRLYICDE